MKLLTINEQKSVIEKQAAEIAKLKAANRDLKEREKRVRESFKNMKRQMPDTPTSATPPSKHHRLDAPQSSPIKWLDKQLQQEQQNEPKTAAASSVGSSSSTVTLAALN